jgi:hypothetical protein
LVKAEMAVESHQKLCQPYSCAMTPDTIGPTYKF